MRSVVVVLKQTVVVAVGIAVLGGLVGVLISHFASSAGFTKGVAYGMIVAGLLVGLLASGSGSPEQEHGGRTVGGVRELLGHELCVAADPVSVRDRRTARDRRRRRTPGPHGPLTA